jgi:hypothetical protein
MARIDGVDPERTEGRIRAVLEAQATKWGGPLLNHLVYARHPTTFQGARAMWGAGHLGPCGTRPRCAHQPQGRRPERLRVLTGHKRCRGQRTGDPRSKAPCPRRVREEPSLRGARAGGIGVRGRHHALGQRPGRRPLRKGTKVLRRRGARRTHGGHRVGELLQQVQPGVAGALAGAVEAEGERPGIGSNMLV